VVAANARRRHTLGIIFATTCPRASDCTGIAARQPALDHCKNFSPRHRHEPLLSVFVRCIIKILCIF